MIETCASDCDRALARAVLYRLAGQVFLHPTASWQAEWRALAAAAHEAVQTLFESGEAPTALVEAIQAIHTCDLDLAEIMAEHARVLGHIPRACATPYETEWTGAAGDLLQFHQMSDVAAFYHAFGLELGKDCAERPDHVSLEIEFLHYLCIKEAWSAEQGLPDLVETCRRTARRFLSEHLARWTGGLCARLRSASRGGFYSLVAALLRAWIDEECRRLEVEPGELFLEASATSYQPEDACVGCGHSAACLSELSRGHD